MSGIVFIKKLNNTIINAAVKWSLNLRGAGLAEKFLASLLARMKFAVKQRHGLVLAVDHIGLFAERVGVAGWVLPRKGASHILRIEISVNETFLGNAHYGTGRNDVAHVYPFIPHAGNCGFSFYGYLPEGLPLTGEYHLRITVINTSGQNCEYLYPLHNDYYAWIQQNEPDIHELEIQRQTEFPYQPLISLVVPTYNTPASFLTDMLESVLKQTYRNWELCIADGASQQPHVKRLLIDYTEKDPRVRVRFLSENLGIAGNSNEALSLVSGEIIGLLDHDDLLAPFALFEVVKILNSSPQIDYLYSDEDRLSEDGTVRYKPYFKPEWSPDTLRSTNYPTHFSVFRKDLLEKIGGFREGFDGSQDYDLILRATAQAREIGHVPKVLYHWRMHDRSLAQDALSKRYTYDAAKKALREHLQRIGLSGSVQDTDLFGCYKVSYVSVRPPLISIIIPSHDHAEDLRRCVSSVLKQSSYRNFEILVVENGSQKKNTFALYKQLTTSPQVRILEWPHPFNYSAVNNFAARSANGEVLLLLNNDTEVINADWLERMLEHAVRKEIGAVGAKLYYPDYTIQHAGIILGLHGNAAHGHKDFPGHASGYEGRLKIIHNVSAVTAACLMTRKEVFWDVNGFDEQYPLALNDVDFCLKLRGKEYLIVWTPYAELYHHESATRGYEDSPERQARFQRENARLHQQWAHIIQQGDPYYNPNLTLEREDFSIK